MRSLKGHLFDFIGPKRVQTLLLNQCNFVTESMLGSTSVGIHYIRGVSLRELNTERGSMSPASLLSEEMKTCCCIIDSLCLGTHTHTQGVALL